MAGKHTKVSGDKKDWCFSLPESFFLPWSSQHETYHPGGLFASMGQMGVGFGISPPPSNPRDNGMKIPCADLHLKYVSPETGYSIVGISQTMNLEAAEVINKKKKKKTKVFKFKLKVANPSLRRLISGGIAGAVSRTAVAPLETIRTHLMVGSNGNSSIEVFENIMKMDGWKGLFRGNLVNVIRIAPSKAIELFAFDTVKTFLSPKPGEPQRFALPPSLVAGACAGVSSTLCTYPLELLKTRITIQRNAYNNLLDAFIKIVWDEGPGELYRGLAPSIIGVIPYAATNYFAYDALRKAYKKCFDREEIGNVQTLLIGSAAGAIASCTTFPLEVARKHLQVGAVGGMQVYKNMLHALMSILEQEGVGGLYKGLGPSCMKLVPAAGISFMCYEACKKILIDEENK